MMGPFFWRNSAIMRKTLLGSIAAGTILASVIALAPVTVYAQGAGPTVTPGPHPNQAQLYQRLKNLFEKEKDIASTLESRLEKAQDLVAKIEQLIDWAQQHGIDVSGLRAALDRFKAALDRARADLNDAKAVLTTHAGFDDSGNVTNPAEARNTVLKAGEDLRDAVQALRGSAQDLRSAFEGLRTQLQSMRGQGNGGQGGSGADGNSGTTAPSSGSQGTSS